MCILDVGFLLAEGRRWWWWLDLIIPHSRGEKHPYLPFLCLHVGNRCRLSVASCDSSETFWHKSSHRVRWWSHGDTIFCMTWSCHYYSSCHQCARTVSICQAVKLWINKMFYVCWCCICRRFFWQKMKTVRCELWYTRGGQELAARGHTDVICVAALWWRDHPERDVILLSRWPFPTDRPRETGRQKDTRTVGLEVTLTFVHCSVSTGWHVTSTWITVEWFDL